MPDRRRSRDGRSLTHADIDTSIVFGVTGSGLHQREKCDPLGQGARRSKKELCREKFLGAELLRIDCEAR